MSTLKPIVHRTRAIGIACLIGFITSAVPLISAEAAQLVVNDSPTKLSPAARAEKAFAEARAKYRENSTNSELAWQFARACFDLGEFATSDSERASVAETGISVARQLAAREPNLAEARYYLGMNLGQLARTKSLGALRLVDQMEVEFQAARRLKEKLDYAGPDRNLGMLYLEAPSIGSIGSRSKARQHLRRAVELAPDYPENRLVLAEAYERWGDTAAAVRELRILSDRWSEFRKTFSDERWAVSWTDWNKRFEVLKAKLRDAAPKLESPRNR